MLPRSGWTPKHWPNSHPGTILGELHSLAALGSSSSSWPVAAVAPLAHPPIPDHWTCLMAPSASGLLVSLGFIAVSAASRAKPCCPWLQLQRAVCRGRAQLPKCQAHVKSNLGEDLVKPPYLMTSPPSEKKTHQLRRFCNVYQAPELRSDNVSCQEYLLYIPSVPWFKGIWFVV